MNTDDKKILGARTNKQRVLLQTFDQV
jgi:hypothetical protein